MPWIDRLEKIGRLVLWLALSSACVLAPITYVRLTSALAEQQRADAKEREEMAARKEAEALAEKKAGRLTLASMGEYLTAFDPVRAKGDVWFTNTTPQRGVVCVTGEAMNATAGTASNSLAACVEVAPYSSPEIALMFAGGELKNVCPAPGACRLKVKDVP
jgi:hypothetical protein